MTNIYHDEPQETVHTHTISDEPKIYIRVLHVDDEADQLLFTKRFLEDMDPYIKVESVSSPEEALLLLREQSFDCVVSDYVMPGLDGVELAYRIRETSIIPIVIYMGKGSEEVAERAFEAGVDDYLRKELDLTHYQVLAKRIKTVVEKHRAEKSLMENERKYKSLVEESRDGILVFTGKECVFANQQAAVLHGCDSVEELMKITTSRLLHPDDREYVEERSLARQRGEDVPPITEYRYILPDGTVRVVQSSSSVIQYNGKPSTLAFIRDITERKLMIEALRESEEKYRTLVENSKDSIVIINPKGDIQFANKASAELAGYTLEEGIGMNVRNILPKKYWLKSFRMLSKALKGEKVPYFEAEIKRKDGSLMSVETGGQAIYRDGNVEGVQIITRDITERKLYEENLQSLYLHAAKLNRAETLDEVYNITYEAMDKTIGFEVLDIIKVENGILRDVYVKGPQRGPLELSMSGPGVTARAARTGEPQYVPDVSQDPDYVPGRTGRMSSEFAVPVTVEGETVVVLNVESSKINAFTNRVRELLEILAFHMASAFNRLRKLSERKKYEERLETLHKHATKLGTIETIEEIAESTMVAIESVLGFNQGGFAIVKGSLLRFIHIVGSKTRETFELSLDGKGITVRVVRTGRTQLVSNIKEDEDFILGPSGRELGSLSELAVPVKIEGEVIGVINIESGRLNAFTVQDQQLVETLSNHVASAIEILRSKEKLHKSMVELKRSNRDLEDYTHVVSHDLKAPLRSITAFSNFLLDDYTETLDETGKEYLNHIIDASINMNQLIEDLLVLSRVGRKYTEMELVDLNNMIMTIKAEFGAQFQEHTVEILVGEMPMIRTQRVWMRQLFSNLIGNGLKFNISPIPRVEVACEEHQSEYVFSVMDNGIGIDERHQERIFKLFQRINTQDEYSGTGAGLAICKKIVESFGGRIWVESQLGSGSTFYFTFPKEMTGDNRISEFPLEIDQRMIQVQEDPTTFIE